jgi:two-component system, LytTR family, response regulator
VKTIRTILVDDEPASLTRLADLLSDESDFLVVGEAGAAAPAFDLIASAQPDLILLDIEMPDESGIDLARRLQALADPPLVLFVTAHEDHALEAFDVDAVDYLLKPLRRDRFQNAIRKVRSRLLESESSPPPETRRAIQRLAVRSGERSIILKIDLIDWIEAAGNYSEIHVGRDVYLLREKISTIEQTLDSSQFVRIHRSIIVNIDRVREAHQMGRGDLLIELHGGKRLPLSRTYRDRIEFLLGRI